ncbi:DUF6624 domain-containing protein [Dyadobacter sp. LHD-138]|uniref:DUF6624 domain-containing protein n=1 Tax=Dyadobacter sp. LHD-138 TaxID=3071413 RepID=UPI0027E0BDE6|nr:DUF6624 domain-containing protein [Dyadobacter sp. LHD-138]MDQ6477135.1 hypothetical protein [Dyadobacter sp. LHD-138]
MKWYIIFFCLADISALAQTESLTEVNKTLEAVHAVDQNARSSLRSCEARFGVSATECKPLVMKMDSLDSINQEVVFQLLEKGWPNAGQISEKANDAIFLVVQHSSLEKQIKYSAVLKEAFVLGKVSPSKYAMFQDRLNVRQGKLQTYGSQTGADQYGNVFFYPIHNITRVDSARREVGLSSIDAYKLNFPGGNVYLDTARHVSNANIILIVHVGNGKQQALKGIKLFVQNEVIGETDDKGFMYVLIPRENYQDLSLKFVANDQKQIRYALKGDRDFFDIYLMFNTL